MSTEFRRAIRLEAKALLLGFVSTAALLGEQDANEIIRRAVQADQDNWKVARRYASSERVEFRRLDAAGRLEVKDVSNYDVTLPEGSPYRRLVSRDDAPLPPEEEKKEREKFNKNIAERRKESQSRRAQRLTEYVQRPDWQREAWRELPAAFDFKLVGEQRLDGHSLYVIQASPRPGYQPKSSTARVFPHLKGQLWVDKHDFQMVKAEMDVIDNIWFGLFLVRVAKGSHAAFEQTRVNDEVWLPLRVQASGSARLGLLKVLHFEHEVSYSQSRDSQADSPIVSQSKSR